MKFLISSLLLATCASLETGPKDITSKFNMTQIEEDVKKEIIVQLMQNDLNQLIEDKVNARVIDLIAQNKEPALKDLDEFQNLLL